MASAALIIATRETTDVDPAVQRGTLIAALPFLGRTLVEHQARQAAAAGARHIVLLVERMPTALLAAVDRLRREGIAVEVARAATDAADRFHPDEAILLIGDGAVAPQALVQRIAQAPTPAIAISPESHGFDRIDAGGWWGGVARIDSATLRSTAAMLGEWDAEATLIRRVVQAGATRFDAGAGADLPVRIEAEDPLPLLETRLARDGGTRDGNWAERWVLAPIARVATRLLAGRPVEPDLLALGSAALGLLGGLTALTGFQAAGLALFLLSAPVAATARGLANVRLGRIAHARRWSAIRRGGGAGVVIGIGLGGGALVWMAAGAATVLAMLALARERAMLGRVGLTPPIWSADADSLAIALLAGAMAAGWPGALVVGGAYALASFAYVQHLLARALSV